MNKDLTNKLKKEFKNLYSKNFYFEHEDGWYDLIYKLSKKIDFICKVVPIKVECLQSKEKFGTLRFYTKSTKENILFPDNMFNVWVDIIQNLIWYTETVSGNTCELCGCSVIGQPSYKNTPGRTQTLCDLCINKKNI